MWDILITMIFAVATIATPAKLDGNHLNIAKASSLNESVLKAEKVPDIAIDENEGKSASEAIVERMAGVVKLKQDPPKQEIVKMIKKHFPDEPLAIKIADCESIGLRHYVKGEVLRGELVKEDVGLFQINETYWLEKSKKLGIDIYDLEGNIKMARHIYDTQGLSAWSASFKNCWKKM